MTFWGLVQVFVNLLLLTSAGFMWVRLSRPAKDDPRMSRGLQLLQSKISVLEDLSDRTEVQVTQLTTLMEQKCRDIQNIIHQAEKQIQKIEASMGKSLEVAKIFQDKIPHQEIIERQNTIKYVKAARMAHQGSSIEDIASQVELSRGEIEFIVKVNREQLQFSEEDLPEWAKEGDLSEPARSADDLMEPLIQKPIVSFIQDKLNTDKTEQSEQVLSNLGAQFRQALQSPAAEVQIPVQNHQATPIMKKPTPLAVSDAGVVKKVVFPKIEVNNNLG